MNGLLATKPPRRAWQRSVDPGKVAALVEALAGQPPEDCVETLNLQRPPVAAAVIQALPPTQAIQILDEPELDHGAAIIAAIGVKAAAPLLDGLAPDRLVAIVRELRVSFRNDLMAAIRPETKAQLDLLLPYPADCAGGIMTTEFIAVPADWTVRAVLSHVREVEHARETIYAIFVLDEGGKLLRVVPLRRLLVADEDAPIVTVASERRNVSVDATAPLDETVRLISKYNLLAIAVVDARQRVIGIVTVDDAIDTLAARQDDQVQQFGGVRPVDGTYLHVGFFGMIRQRAGWLCILFLAEMLTASAMQVYEDRLEKAVVLALFIPLIMSSGGNSGSQATSLVIRALSLGELKLGDWWRVLLREIPSGLILGAILGVIGLLRITIWQHLGLFDYGHYWPLVAVTIAASLVGIVTAGSLVGALLPFALKACGVDPAVASAPFVATLVDVTGIVIYFSIASLILSGTLL